MIGLIDINERNIIYQKPIMEKVNSLKDSKGTTFLVGKPGSGKSTILDYLVKHNENYIDATLSANNAFALGNKEMLEAYYVALVIDSIINHIEKTDEKLYKTKFYFMSKRVKTIIDLTRVYVQMGSFYTVLSRESREVLNVAKEGLLSNFYDILMSIQMPELTLVFDDFDKAKPNDALYQKIIFDNFKDYFNIIMTVSSENNPDYLLNLGNVVEVCYDKDTIINIINRYLIYNHVFNSKQIDIIGINKLLTDDAIDMLIKGTKGNISKMKSIIFNIYSNLDLRDIDRNTQVLEEVLNPDPALGFANIGDEKRRRLYL